MVSYCGILLSALILGEISLIIGNAGFPPGLVWKHQANEEIRNWSPSMLYHVECAMPCRVCSLHQNIEPEVPPQAAKVVEGEQ